MLFKQRIYKKKLHISHLILNKSLDLSKLNNKQVVIVEDGQLDPQKKINLDQVSIPNKYVDGSLIQFNKQKQDKKKLQSKIKDNHRNALKKIFFSSSCKINQNQPNLQTILQNKLQGQLLKTKFNHSALKNIDIEGGKHKSKYENSKVLSRNSSLKQHEKYKSSRNLSHQKSFNSFRDLKQSNLKLYPSPLNKSKQFTLVSYQKEPSVYKQPSTGSLTKFTSVIQIYPKKQNKIKRARKTTVMNRYDFQYQNIRLAHKILSIKPTKACDKNQQNKFFKKQKYYRELRSCSIQIQSPQNLNQISQSVSLPRINQRFHTIEY